MRERPRKCCVEENLHTAGISRHGVAGGEYHSRTLWKSMAGVGGDISGCNQIHDVYLTSSELTRSVSECVGFNVPAAESN